MGFIPIFLKVDGKQCLVVGGGDVAQRKVETLMAAGAAVTVVSLDFTPALAEYGESGRISTIRRAYQEGDMAGHDLVYAATANPDLGRRLFEEAARLNILINVADAPEYCSFIVPSVIRRGRLQVAISTEGASPALARNLRERMENWLGDELEVLLEVMAGARDWLRRREGDPAVRARKLNALAASSLGTALRRSDWRAVEKILAECLGSDVSLGDLGVESNRLLPKKGEPAG